MSVVVVGSINMDLVVDAPRLPRAGETIRGHRFRGVPGGKGANQAVAAARQGARTSIVGRVGADEHGSSLVASLAAAGVDVSGVGVDDEAPTGVAAIVVADGGENAIVTVGGANHRLDATALDALDALLPGARVLLVQLEIPMEVVAGAVARARSAGVAVVLDPAPLPGGPLPDELLSAVTWITPNAHEAEALTGITVKGPDDAERAAGTLQDRGTEHAVVTLGPHGCWYAGPESSFHVPAPAVTAVDTTAAGDAFNGTLAAALAGGFGVRDALDRACAAGALAATRPGAQPSIPTGAEVEALVGALHGNG